MRIYLFCRFFANFAIYAGIIEASFVPVTPIGKIVLTYVPFCCEFGAKEPCAITVRDRSLSTGERLGRLEF